MSIIRSQYTNINGNRVELSRKTFKMEERHFLHEPKSQKPQLDSAIAHETRKDVKNKNFRKLT